MTPAAVALLTQLPVHTRAAVAAFVAAMDTLDGGHELEILLPAGAPCAVAPGVVTAGRYLHVLAQPGHFEPPPVLRDEGEDFRLRGEPEGPSFFSRSFSSLS